MVEVGFRPGEDESEMESLSLANTARFSPLFGEFRT